MRPYVRHLFNLGPRHNTLGFLTRGFSYTSGRPTSGKKSQVEQLWREFFSDPSEWRDHRLGKVNPRFPDFKHQKTQQSLWLNCRWIPPWAEAKLANMTSGIIKSSSFAWNQRLSRYAKAGQHKKTMELYGQMQNEGISPDRVTFFPVLSACASLGALEEGRHIHTKITQNDFQSDLFLGNSLIDMYGKCGSMNDAERVFNQMSKRNVVTWTAMIQGYVKCQQGQQALEIYQKMQKEQVDPDPVTFLAVLNACASVAEIEEGRAVHEEILQRGYEADVCLSNCLIDMYSKCGSIEEAEKVFDKMHKRDVVTWNAMILAYVKCGQGHQALELYRQMQQEQVDPDRVTIVAVLRACASIAALEEGKGVHKVIIQRGLEADVFVLNSLVDMYGKCERIEDAERVFNHMPMRTVASWNAMILGYVKCRKGLQALELYQKMHQEQVDPDHITFVGVLNACASVELLEEGRHAHEEIIRRGYETDMCVNTCLIHMYGNCGSIEDAERVFTQIHTRDVITWTSMILGYVKCGQGHQALELYQQMKQEQMDPNPVTFVAVLNACASVAALEKGRSLHDEIIQKGYEADVHVNTCLIDMYVKCGAIKDAERVFKQMPTKNVVTWNAMILGYVKCRQGQQALELYQQMQQEHVDPDPATFVAVLNACASVAALEEGRHAHKEIVWRGYEADVRVNTCLIDMYGKCGSIGDAERVFKQMPTRDVVVWTAMLAGYSRHGYANEALQHFKQMSDILEVNGVTFICLLRACSHGGLVDEGLDYFKSMSPAYNVSPTVEHYACVVDLMGRSGHFSEAEDMIMSMPIDPNAAVWMSLLGACRRHVNVELGEHCAKQILELEPENATVYVMLSDIYVAAGKWESSARVNQERLDRGLKQTTGWTWIEVNKKVHSFVGDDCEHPQILDIYAELKGLLGQINCVGLSPDTRFEFLCLCEENKRHHSEKLAIAYGLIGTAPGTPLHIVKNVPACANCHQITKFIAKITRRTIIVRDGNHIHQFEQGLCSCGDYW